MTAHANLADNAKPKNHVTRRIADRDGGLRQRLTDGLADVIEAVVALMLSDDRAAFGLPVNGLQTAVEAAEHLARQFRGDH